MRKQKRVFTDSLLTLAILLCMLAAVAFVSLTFTVSARADEPDAPEESVTVQNAILDETASKAQRAEVEFTVASSWIYGTKPQALAPRAKHEAEGSAVSVSIKLNDEQIASGIAAKDLIYYINEYMPVGEYEMILAYPSVTVETTHTEWWNNAEHEQTEAVMYAAFDATYNFKVLPAPIPESYVQQVTSRLNGENFDYVYDGNIHFYSDDISFDLLDKGAGIYDRGADKEGVYWAQEDCDKYFGGFSLTYNLYRMLNDHYHTSEYFATSGEDADCVLFAPREPGKYTVYYQLAADNYVSLADVASDSRRDYVFYVTVFGVVDIPTVPVGIYTGENQKGYVYDTPLYTVDAYNGWTDAGTYKITLRLTAPLYYMWKGQTIETRTETVNTDFTITKASNDWTVVPDVVRWVEGEYDEAENIIVGESKFGAVTFEITDADGNVVYVSNGVNKLAELKAGNYNFTATVIGSDNYNVLQYSKFIRVLEKQGLPWWGTLCIVLGALLLVAVIILILYKKGVFRLLNDKIVLAIRTKATIDATIAAVRANKIAEQSKASRAAAEERDRAEEQAAARKQAAAEARNKSVDEKVAALEAKAQATADKAEAMRLKAEAMQARIQIMKDRAASQQTKSSEAETAPEQPDKDNKTE